MSPSGETGSGESVAVMFMSASGVVYCVFSCSVLLPSFVSSPVPLTSKTTDSVPSLMPMFSSFAAKTTVKTEVIPVGNEALVQVKVAFSAPTAGATQFQPAGVVTDWNASVLVGTTLKFTLVAVSGPEFVTGTVYVM